MSESTGDPLEWVPTAEQPWRPIPEGENGDPYLAPSTVRDLLSSVYRKLGISSQQELILLFYGFWQDGRTPPALLGADVLRQPRALCAACRSPRWR